MVVINDSDEVRLARKTALELLLSDHAGDCVGPCRTGCPARLDIPNFIERISAGDVPQATEIVTDDLTLPASLGRVCPRLCEERCRQCEVKEALSIRNLHRFAADVGQRVSPVRRALAVRQRGRKGRRDACPTCQTRRHRRGRPGRTGRRASSATPRSWRGAV